MFHHTQEEDSGKETEDSEIKERINRRKAADKEKRNKKNSYEKLHCWKAMQVRKSAIGLSTIFNKTYNSLLLFFFIY